MKRFLIITGLVLGATLVPVRSIAATFSQLVVYGDSLSDLGRAAAATNGQIPGYPQGGGRFSNGPIWIEYLAASLRSTTNPIPITDFAIGGATTGTVNIGQALSPSFIGIQTQVANNPISDPAALYVIWGGANDYLSAIPTDPCIPTKPCIPISNLTSEINTLISRGATNILIPNLPNLGALPATRNFGTTETTALNNLTALHNGGLETAISQLQLTNPTVKLNLLNVNSLFNQVVANPSNFGLNNVTDGCLLVECSTPNTYLFWDDRHPTTAAQQLIGNLAFQTVSPTTVPEPMTILGSIMAFGSAIVFKRKIKSSNLKDRELVKIH